jgi:hypothetical protein
MNFVKIVPNFFGHVFVIAIVFVSVAEPEPMSSFGARAVFTN